MRLTAAAVLALAACAAPEPDTPAEVIGEAHIPTAGRQVPIPFEIAVPAARVAANHSYAAQARIEYDGKLRWTPSSSGWTLSPIDRHRRLPLHVHARA